VLTTCDLFAHFIPIAELCRIFVEIFWRIFFPPGHTGFLFFYLQNKQTTVIVEKDMYARIPTEHIFVFFFEVNKISCSEFLAVHTYMHIRFQHYFDTQADFLEHPLPKQPAPASFHHKKCMPPCRSPPPK